MIFPRVLQNSPERHIKVREPLQIPVINRRVPEIPYLLAVESSRILFGPGDHTVRMADRVISIKTDKGMEIPSFGILQDAAYGTGSILSHI